MAASFMATHDLLGIFISIRFIHCIYPVSSRSLALVSRASSQDHQNSNPEPPRITSNVKQSLQYLKLLKELREKRNGTNRPSTSYRKKKVDKEESLYDLEYYEDPTTRLYYTKGDFEFARPVLLVDGYNMCGYWAKLKKHFVKGNIEYARRKLLEELITFSVIKGVKVVVVFDATLSGMPNHKESFQGIDVIFSATSSADSWIEKEVMLLMKDGCPKVWVATSDLMQQHSASASGAYVWSCKALLTEVKDAKKERDQILHDKKSYSMQGKLLEHNLDPQVINALKNLKQRLAQSDSN